ncbi:hypothetical protein EBR96_07085 [bacterium]|nr:hypothetical protein [bacterium]
MQVVSDIDFTICTPQATQEPFHPKCIAPHELSCPIQQLTDFFPGTTGRCIPRTESEFHVTMSCPFRDAFSEEFYAWLASLDFEADQPIHPTANFLRSLDEPAILLTNRDEQCRDKTIQFMIKHNIPFKELLMRPKGDYRPLWEFKTEQMHSLARSYSKILWLDDQEPPIVLANVEWRHPNLILPNSPESKNG